METNELQISRNIKSCREKRGKTQDDVANAIGCNIDEFFLKNNFTESE